MAISQYAPALALSQGMFRLQGTGMLDSIIVPVDTVIESGTIFERS